jgi:hypothetical protein
MVAGQAPPQRPFPDGRRRSEAGVDLVDVRGPRFSAGVTTLVLAAALTVRGPVGVGLVLWQWLVFAVAAGAGLRYSLYGRLFAAAARRLGRGRAPKREPASGPRFAQACGFVILSVALAAFAAGTPTLGWIAAAVVLGFAALLAATDICVGCRIYGLTRRLPVLPQRP